MDVSKPLLTKLVIQNLRAVLDDPVVEITEPQANVINIRIGQDRGGPRYFTVKVSENQ